MKSIALASAALALVAAASAQTLYTPTRTVADQKIALRGWGSGLIAQADDYANDGSYSLRVSTRNFFQGGIVTFGSPVDLSGAFGDKNNLLTFAFSMPETTTSASGGGGKPGSNGNAGDPGDPLGGGQRGGQVGGGVSGGSAPTLSSTATLRNLRMIVTTTDGMKSEAYIPIRTSADPKAWRNVAIPLSAINGFARTNKTVQSVAFSGDATAVFFVGDLKIANDATPISGDIRPADEFNVGIGQEVEFSGRGFGGATVLKYAWDFDSADGIQEDAVGVAVKRRFRKAGTFTVTLTIGDSFGIKPAATRTVKVTVNP